MAETLVKVVLENLNSLIQKQFGLLWGVQKEMDKLSSTFSTVLAVLEDTEERQFTERAVRNWLQKLSDVAFELDDVLDDCEMEAWRVENERQKRRWTQKVRSSLSGLNPMNALFHLRIANKMKKIGDRLDQIANERMKFHLREVAVGERRDQAMRERRRTSSIITRPHVYGREEDKEKIVRFLVDDARDRKDTSIYPIVGLGGIGKTTLAQHIFNDERVGSHFELKVWVCVSEDFDANRLVKAIIESATGSACEALDVDPLQKRLQQILGRKRYLIILDDVWNEDQEQWDKLKYVLDCGSDGSSIVVTTRLKKVAAIMGTVTAHYLFGLCADDCWLLFKQRAFGNEEDEKPNLVEIGKEIVKKCGGVPLAAKALGGLMRFKREEHEWLSVKESELWNLPEEESSILPALRLSYFHLPVEQRRCFAYCAIFPKDYSINKEKLILLWMANGLISSERGLDVEDIGDNIFNELRWRSFIQDVENIFGSYVFSGFKMHDLVHDLAQSIMKSECCAVQVDDMHPLNLPNRVRHLNCYESQGSWCRLVNLPSAKFLRTFMIRNSKYSISFPFYVEFSSLRVLQGRLTMPMPAALISNIKHLRYLNLSESNIEILPESVCFLIHLLTLDLSYCQSLRKLPKHMSRLKSLRHLYIRGCSSLLHMPPNIGRLSSLRTLTDFFLNGRKGCHLDELCHLNIGGSLSIRKLEKVRSPTEAKSANLLGKRNLKRLSLCWSDNENESQDNSVQVLEALAPSQNLEALSIRSYKGIRFPYWFSNETLGNVIQMNLHTCKNCLELPPFGKLRSLQSLGVSENNFVQSLDDETYDGDLRNGFERLETLHLQDLPNLERLSRREGKVMFPCLSRLEVHNCPKLTLLHGLSLVCLKYLCLYNLPNLERLVREEGKVMFPCLSSLNVFDCFKLTLPSIASAKYLYAKGVSEVLLKSISNLHGLTRLHIEINVNMTSLPQGMLRNLTSLRSLVIIGFTKVQEFPSDVLTGLIALEDLTIRCCGELKCLSEGIFQTPVLKRLKIVGCKKLKSLSESFWDLTSLQSLCLVDFPELEWVPSYLGRLSSLQTLNLSGLNVSSSEANFHPGRCIPHKNFIFLREALPHLPSLQFMQISDFPELTSLPDSFGNLVSLRELTVSRCPNLENIPISIQNLTNLQKLSIKACFKLQKRYEKEVGEDWHKIAHIPDVYFGETMRTYLSHYDTFEF